MSGSLVSDFGIGDTNFDNVMLTLEKTYDMKLSLSEFDNNTVVPLIESGSVVDVGGALYKFGGDEAISTTDPYTSSVVADGDIYIVLQKSMGTASGAITDATGYAIGSTTFTLASAGTGTIIVGDRIKFTGDDISYVITSGDTDISDGGSITIASPGIYTAITTSATAITVSSGSVLASWTATAPEWRGDYQGWYKSGTVDRYVGGCVLDTSVYTGEFVYNKIKKDYFKNTIISVYASSGGPNGTASNPVIFNTELEDSRGEYSNTTGLVTFKSAGLMHIDVSISNTQFTSGSAITVSSDIYLNSDRIGVYMGSATNASNSIWLTAVISKTFRVEAGDVLKIVYSPSSNIGYRGGLSFCRMNIHQIGD